ncbi:hypothetical protein NET03_11210 [Thermomicrobium sp. CFH 73360]|uniref:hypothetical protein n=1 Tax=Thermomicrobium sp. CFH 73360 TaxID=2951987 RepID=UPI0020771690|nr:hypothetical protein [Thermomicrobium sp. CFH 73360]MCM8747095.1 hypothetical protein [Thermomicrobium sp. CFH 73360]
MAECSCGFPFRPPIFFAAAQNSASQPLSELLATPNVPPGWMIEARTIHSAEAPRFAPDQPPVFDGFDESTIAISHISNPKQPEFEWLSVQTSVYRFPDPDAARTAAAQFAQAWQAYLDQDGVHQGAVIKVEGILLQFDHVVTRVGQPPVHLASVVSYRTSSEADTAAVSNSNRFTLKGHWRDKTSMLLSEYWSSQAVRHSHH